MFSFGLINILLGRNVICVPESDVKENFNAPGNLLLSNKIWPESLVLPVFKFIFGNPFTESGLIVSGLNFVVNI